jgi:2-amino-4-hydroxy-6-hydroxymethyldihydropteridine diphosphokinase
MNHAVLALGSNAGDRSRMLSGAIGMLGEYGIVSKVSPVYETAAWGNTNQADFLNQVVVFETKCSAPELMQAIGVVEQTLGRTRRIKWEPRQIDIDILFFNNEVIETEGLTIPHPLLHKRRFTLQPLADLMPDYIHPVLNMTVKELLAECDDMLPAKRLP